MLFAGLLPMLLSSYLSYISQEHLP
jgi:hypothetical protein